MEHLRRERVFLFLVCPLRNPEQLRTTTRLHKSELDIILK